MILSKTIFNQSVAAELSCDLTLAPMRNEDFYSYCRHKVGKKDNEEKIELD